MRALLAACGELSVDYNTLPNILDVFNIKRNVLIHAPYTRMMVFWHISNILPMIS